MLSHDFTFDYTLYNKTALSQAGLTARYLYFQAIMIKANQVGQGASLLAEDSYDALNDDVCAKLEEV